MALSAAVRNDDCGDMTATAADIENACGHTARRASADCRAFRMSDAIEASAARYRLQHVTSVCQSAGDNSATMRRRPWYRGVKPARDVIAAEMALSKTCRQSLAPIA